MDKNISILGQVPFLRFLIPFILGIYLSNKISIEHIGHLWICPIICVILLSIWNLILSTKTRTLIAIKGLLITLFFLSFGTAITSNYQRSLFSPEIDKMEWYTGIVSDQSPASNERQKYVVNIDAGYADSCYFNIHETVVVYVKENELSDTIIPGSRISFREKLSKIEPPKNPGEFDYQSYMLRKGIRYQLYSRGCIKIENTREHTLRTKLFLFRMKLLNRFKQYGISDNEFGVLAALTLGEKDYLSDEIKEGFTNTGAMHVLAVSGLHVGIIYVILMFLLKPLCRNQKYKIYKSLVAIVMLWGYALTTGLSPSVFRATTMFSFLAIGEGLKRKSSIYNSLCTSAFVLLLFNPNLLFEVGFQLSYLAVFSIVFFQPKFGQLLKPKTLAGNYLWQLFTVSLAAQIGTSPISIFYFNQFACYFWLSNFVVIPAAGLILYTTTLFFLVSFIPTIGLWVGTILKWIIKAMNWAILTIEKLPNALISDIWISQGELVALYIIFASCTLFIIYRKKWAIFTSLLVLIGFISDNCYREIKKNNQQLIIFHQNSKNMLISFVCGKELVFASENEELTPYEERIIENTCKNYRIRKAKKINDLENNTNSWICKYKETFVYQGFRIGTVQANKKLSLDAQYEKNARLTLSSKKPIKNIFISKPADSETENGKTELLEYNLQKDGALSVYF